MANLADSDRSTLVGPERAAPSAAVPPRPDLDDTTLFFNRELSWLDFNDRVLQLAEDPSVPLLERVKFCAIYQDNLDEFFMVRVANLHEQVEAGRDARGADGISASEVIEAFHDRVSGLRDRLADCFERDLRPALAEHGLRFITVASANAAERAELEDLFENQIFPTLTPLVVGHGRPFPYISNLSLSLGVVLRDPEQEADVMARVQVPPALRRGCAPGGRARHRPAPPRAPGQRAGHRGGAGVRDRGAVGDGRPLGRRRGPRLRRASVSGLLGRHAAAP